MMLSAGEPLAWVSKEMGHANVTVTLKNYARWIPDSNPTVGNSAVEMFSKNSRKIVAKHAKV